MATGRSSRGATPAPRESTLDALLSGASELGARFYRATGREVKALGIAVDAGTFERVALLAAERAGETAEAIIARGWVEFEHDRIRMRIADKTITE